MLKLKIQKQKKMVTTKKAFEKNKQITGIRPKSTKAYVKKQPKRSFSSLFRKKLILRGIMHSQSTPVAVINNQVLRENDTIEGVKIIKIYDNKVIVEDNDVEQTILLKN